MGARGLLRICSDAHERPLSSRAGGETSSRASVPGSHENSMHVHHRDCVEQAPPYTC